MTERQYLVLLSSYLSFGPVRIKLLLSYFKSAEAAWKSTTKELSRLNLREEMLDKFKRYRDNFDPKKYFAELRRLGIDYLTIKDENFPKNLRGISACPTVLYIKGKLKENDELAIAIVGSRKCSSYGREVAEKFSEELASLGITIVSGLARGIDTVSHASALAAGGRTIAVLGCGLDSVYPPENIGLASEIIKKGSALISEYPLGYPAIPTNFASRNRIISGLSRGVLVIEGAEKSGTLLTVGHAADQGREVFAVPGEIFSPLSFAPHYLLKNGAKLVASPNDILEEMGWGKTGQRENVRSIIPGSPEEEKILNFLENEALHLDELARISNLDIGVVSARLTVMELKGIVKNMGGGIYRKI